MAPEFAEIRTKAQRNAMDELLGLLPIVIVVLIIFYFARRHRKKVGPERTGPNGEVPYGVHGWLAFYVVTSISLGPLMALGVVNANIMEAESKYPHLLSLDGWVSYKTAKWVTVLFIIGWQIWVALELKTKSVPRSVFRVKVFVLVAPSVAFLADVAAASIFLNVPPAQEVVSGLVASIITSGIWFAYFYRSKRVRNTYGLAKTSAAVPIQAPFAIAKASVAPATDVSQAVSVIETRLQTLKDLRERDLISDSDYETKKSELLAGL